MFQELGYIDPTKAKLRVPFQFVPPVVPASDALPPKPMPKAQPIPVARQPGKAGFHLRGGGGGINRAPKNCGGGLGKGLN